MTIEIDTLSHQIFLDRLAHGLHRDYMKYVKQAEKKILNKGSGNYTTISIVVLVDEIKEIFNNATANMLSQLQNLTEYEVRFTKRLLEKYLGRTVETPPKPLINNITVQTTFTKQSTTLTEAVTSFGNKKQSEYIQQLSAGITNGEEKEEIQRRVEDKTSGLITMQSLALASLTALAVSGYAKKSVVEEDNKVNQDTQILFQWTSVLENTTCPYCEGLHGEVFRSDDLPGFPAHARCQCSLIMVEQNV